MTVWLEDERAIQFFSHMCFDLIKNIVALVIGEYNHAPETRGTEQVILSVRFHQMSY
jgi:hypothetical protein